jgi:hypothetical protein
MRKSMRIRVLATAGLAVSVAGLTGCQANIAGMTLPSPYYMEHPPQYFPQDPDFPLIKELATQQEQAGLLKPRESAAPAGPLPGVGGPSPVAPAATPPNNPPANPMN